MQSEGLYKQIQLDDKLLATLVDATKQAELKGAWEEVLEDGTAKPPPAPEAVRALNDPAHRQRADALWFYCFRLECLISQWNEWLLDAPLSGRSDPTLASSLANGVKDCVRTLCGLGLFKEPEAQVLAAFPDPEQAPIGTRWYLWTEGAEWMHQSIEGLRRLQPLRDRLWGCIRTLETKPEALLLVGLERLSVKPPDGPSPRVAESLAPSAPVRTTEDSSHHEAAPPVASRTEAPPSTTPGTKIEPPPANLGVRQKRGGRIKGRNKVLEALTQVTTRMKDRLSVGIPDIAREVGCTPKNLHQSKKFMSAYRMLINASARTPRKGSKIDGMVEAEDDEDE